MSDYRSSLNEVSREVRPTAGFAFKVGLAAMLVVFGLSVVGYGLGWFSEAAKVTQEQFGARALLQKYESFKDMSAQLDKKLADITVYEGRMKSMDETYKDVPRIKWPREDREQYNVWSSETAGVKASFNSLAADYNAQMSKFNYAFANVGDLPKGADKPLPREYKSYVVQ
jgi:hypothetical protein